MEHITIDPEIMMGKPTLKGTRLTVELLLDHLGDGESIDESLKGYPQANREQVLAALRCAARVLREPFIGESSYGEPWDEAFDDPEEWPLRLAAAYALRPVQP